MKRFRTYRSSAQRYAFTLVAAGFVLILFGPALFAQCPGGTDPDSLGCADVTKPSYPSPLDPSPADINIQSPVAQESPRPDIPAGNLSSSTIEGRAGTSSRSTPVSMPVPLTEFQRFVLESTGQLLSVYGTSLFTAVPTTFAPIESGSAPQEMIVATDDELHIRIWGQVNFSDNLRVSREGDIYIPKVGEIHVAGLTFSQVPAHVRSAIERVYRNFDLSVDMGKIHSIQVYVTGFARRPGLYTVSGLSTLVDAVFQSGGPGSFGSLRHVLLKRSGKTIADFDLYALLINGNKTGDVQLQAGDVIFIPPAGPQVALLGSVGKSAIYELRGRETLGALLSEAGGATATAAGAQVLVDRIVDHAHRQAFDFSMDQAGLASPLDDGDIVRINPIVSSFRDAVTLRGAVANPGRFRWHAGMRLSELMPDRDSLLKRDYWWRRTQLGLPALEFVSPSGLSISVAERLAQHSASLPMGLATPAALAAGAPQALPEANPTFETNWNEAVIERLNRATMTTSLIPFQLGKLVLDHDRSQDLELMPGDVVTIFSQSDFAIPVHEQTKYVTLEGEFVHPGVYSVRHGETLRSLVKRAGGLTPRADLYASVFTRRSTQVTEQQRLSEFADQLEHQLLMQSANAQSAAIGSEAQQRTLQTQSTYRELIARIRDMHATGRIILHIHPPSGGDYQLPDMHLEDGDHLMIPFTPETVQVIGAVFNPNAFLYQPHANVHRFLSMAGGPTRDADRKRIYVLRADGSVLGRASDASVFSGSIGDLRLNPGDTIVVPEKYLRASVFSQALGWAQTVSQSSLTALEAAAISTQ
jgi:polysaccharide export outer membrane protein